MKRKVLRLAADLGYSAIAAGMVLSLACVATARADRSPVVIAAGTCAVVGTACQSESCTQNGNECFYIAPVAPATVGTCPCR